MPENSYSKLLSSTLLITVFAIANLALGFLLQILLADRFGAGETMDVYVAASTIPLMLNLILVGALNVTVVPLLIDYRINHGETQAWHIINTGITLVFIITSIVAGLLIIFSYPVMRLIAPGLIESETFALAPTILSILLISTIFTGVAAFISSVYYSNKSYFVPSMAFAINNLLILLITLILGGHFGILAVAIGYVIGSLMQCILVTPVLRHNFRPLLQIHHPGVSKLIFLIIPWIASSLISKLNPLIERRIASNFPEGSISHLAYAFMGITAITIVTSKGISVTSLSHMSEITNTQQPKKLSHLLSISIRVLILLLTLVSIWIIGSGKEVVRMLFERGEFTSADTEQVSVLMIAYLGYYVFGTLGVVLVNVLYSRQNTITMLKVNIIGFCLYICLAVVLSHYFGLFGLAAATSIEFGINVLVLFFILRSWLEELDVFPIALVITKAAISSLITIITSYYLFEKSRPINQSALFVLLYVVLSSGLYVISLKLLKTQEITIFMQQLSKLVSLKTTKQVKHVS